MVYVLILMQPGLGNGFSVLGAFRGYEEAQAEARRFGVDQCCVLQTTLK